MSVVYPQYSVLFLVLFFTLALSADSEQTVTDCIQLQEALNKNPITTVVVRGVIRCTREIWHVPIVVQRNVELKGEPEQLNENEGLPTIDWTDISHVVIVERASISVHDLVMFQNSVGLSGITIAFIHTREGAAAVFAGVILVIQQCAQNARTYHALVSEIPRPTFLTGDQQLQSIGSNVLLIQDVAIWWPNLNSVWQLCNSAAVCLDGYQGHVPLEEYFTSGLVANTCSAVAETNTEVLATVAGMDIMVKGAVPDEPEIESEEGGGDNTTSTLIVVTVVIAGVMFVTAILSYKFICGRARDHTKSVYSRREQSSMEGGSPRDGNSPRHPGNKNDMVVDLFERGTNVPMQDVVVGTLLGRGGFGKVYKGTWKGTAVAIKVIEHGERLLQNDLNLPFEAYLSRHISHPNVVQTFLIHTRQKDSPDGITVDTLDLQTDSPGSGKRSVSRQSLDVFSNMAPFSTGGHDPGEMFQTWLVLEFCDRGALSKVIRKGELLNKETGAPLLDHILLSALDVANAMNYLHSLGITHGDLKAENVLLKSASTDRRGFFCKVSDFGLSRYVGETDNLQTFTYGTISHMPPELLRDGAFSTAVDIYSFGILLWELLATEQPYSDKHTGHIMMAVISEGKRPNITDKYPEMYADLMKDCWKQKPEDRPKFAVIVRRLKAMLADLEIGNAMLRDVNDSATSHNAPMNRRLDSGEDYMATLPDALNRSTSIPPRMMFVSEPASLHPRTEQDQDQQQAPTLQWPSLSRQCSTDSTATLSASPVSSESGFSDFSQAS